VVSNKDRSVLAEQFRILRTNIGFLLGPNLKCPVLLVSSSIAGEGKTFCSMNLAAVWGIAGKKTVILELDLRKTKIAKSLGLINEKGITHFMLGQVNAEDIPIPIPNTENLYIVPAGIIPPNPSEMIMDPRMGEFISYLKTVFDLIIIDSAPVGLVSDTFTIAEYADASLYVIRQRYTLKKQVDFIDDMATRYAQADLVICRAGAITVSELCAAGVASILVPFIASTTSHQRDNAEWMAQIGAAFHQPQKELNIEALASLIKTITRERCLQMAEAAYANGKREANESIAQIIEKLGSK
jgi:capsular exopolysaccharide synthesis family protein